MDKSLYVFLVILMIMGGFLRMYKITENPPSLNIDEVSIGYNAYSILKTGRDEYGKYLPVAFESVGDFKPSGLIYLTVPSIYFFGLNEFGVRFPTAFFSTLSIIAIYFLTFEITRKRNISLISSLFLTFSPWHIYYSRYAVEATVALFFMIVGVTFLLKLFEKKPLIFALIAGFFLSYSMYTYHTQRIFVPLLVLLIFLLKKDKLKNTLKELMIFSLSALIFSLPLLYSILFGSGAARAQMTFITNDIEFTRPVLAEITQNKYLLLFFYWLRKYLNYFTSSFLFHNGLTMTQSGNLGIGVHYLFEIPFLIFSIVSIVKKRIENSNLLLGWILLGILPASLTQNEQHPLRTLQIAPAVIILVSYGAFYFFVWVKSLKVVFARAILMTFVITLIWSIVHSFAVFSYYFPYYKSEAFMQGTKETVLFALENKEKYDEIIFDPVRGVEGPFIVSVPHMYILFYSGYDPSTYQLMQKRSENESYGFDKFTVRKINWSLDRGMKNKLFIGSPWSLPTKDIKEENILKRIYLANGQLAFLIVRSE